MKNAFFSRERAGAVVFEAVLATPITLLLVGLCLFFMVLLISWTSYGGLASELASDLNLRSTGLTEANSKVPGGNIVMSGSEGQYDYTISKDQFTINGQESGSTLLNSYKNALIYSALHYKNQFYMPFSEFKDCNVDILQLGKDGTYNEEIPSTTTLSNYIVRVTINYGFKPFRLLGIDLGDINIQTTGYSVVT